MCTKLGIIMATGAVDGNKVEIGSGSITGNLFGKKRDFTYNVPDGAIAVTFSSEDNSPNSLNIGSGNGKATLNWDKQARKAHVHAWVDGAVGGGNSVSWTVYAWSKP